MPWAFLTFSFNFWYCSGNWLLSRDWIFILDLWCTLFIFCNLSVCILCRLSSLRVLFPLWTYILLLLLVIKSYYYGKYSWDAHFGFMVTNALICVPSSVPVLPFVNPHLWRTVLNLIFWYSKIYGQIIFCSIQSEKLLWIWHTFASLGSQSTILSDIWRIIREICQP